MRHRIRVAGILHEDGRVLLVEQRSPHTGLKRWSPPGGGLELSDTDVFAGVEREVLEETGLLVKAGQVRYISEFFHTHYDVLMLELWIDCFPMEGEYFDLPHLNNARHDDFITDVRWLSRADLSPLRVNNPLLAPMFWKNIRTPNLGVQHLGRWEE